MTLTRLAAIAVPAAVLAAAVSVPFAAHAATTHPTATTKHDSTPAVAVYDCANQPQVRPGTFDIFCDGSGAITKLTWSSWSTAMAAATGVEYVDNCEPNCAQGKWSHQDVDVVFWRSKPVKGHPGEYGYTEMTTLFPNEAAGSHNPYTQTPPGEFPGEF
jgi:hypothetical protein